MSELVRGQITDRPWGLTLGALGLRGLTGRLVLPGDGYQIAFREGAVVHAMSKDPRDSAVRIAVTSSLVTAPHAAQIAKRSKGRDEIEAIAEIAKLTPEQVDRLQRSVIAQRTARTFALERGEFFVDDILPEITASAVDVRPIVYLGAHSHMSDDRLAAAVDGLGTYFRLKLEAIEDIPRFGFTDAERDLVYTLRDGATIGDLVISQKAISRRALLAIVYALASALALDFDAAPAAPGRARTRGKASIPPDTGPARMRSKVNSKVSFKKLTPRKAELELEPPPPPPPPEPEPELDLEPSFDLGAALKSELEAEPEPTPVPAPAIPVGRRTNQLMAFVAIPREPAPRARAETVEEAPLEEINQSPAERARTPTPFGPGIAPRRPAK